jgi:predicted DNA-binding transcriptional regulator YafY
MPVANGSPAAEMPEGWKEFLMPIESIEQGVRKLLAFGANVKILGPQSLKDELIEELLRLRELYGKP